MSEPDIALQNLEQTKNYINKSTVAAKAGRKCVDGRYHPDQGTGMIARPGADGGYVMALEAVNRKKQLGLTPEECFNTVYKAVTKLTGKFYLHTDHHVDDVEHNLHHGLIGCGHIAKAARKLFSWEYDVRSDDIKRMVHYARYLCEISKGIEMVNLDGEHKEKGVLVIHSDKYTVLSDNPELSQMYFIYDVDRDHAFMKQLVAEMAIPGLTLADLQKEADLQLGATLQNLALRLPVYDVVFNGKKPEVSLSSIVKQKPFMSRMHMPLHSPFGLRKHFLKHV